MHINALLKWYTLNQRDLPWRRTRNPYLIWVSEVILQQTRVEQGLPYYEAFVSRYPDVSALACTPKADLFKLWQGLGYYNRAANMLHTAQSVVNNLGGQFPASYDSLIQLKGIGPYTAAAVSSMASNEPRAVVDGNVFRVIARQFMINEETDSGAGKRLFNQLAGELLDKKNPGTFNQAMMELGATVCTPRNPDCASCPVHASCQAYAAGRISEYPKKKQKKPPVNRHLNYLIFVNRKKTFIHLRNQGVWKNLYEPPFIETHEPVNEKELNKLLRHSGMIPETGNLIIPEPVYETVHQLTHQRIQARFWICRGVTPRAVTGFDLVSTEIKNLHSYPVHRLFDKFLNYYTLQNL